MEKATRDDVAVFVDFENVYVSVREKFDATPNFELIMDRCEDYGRIVIARAYADWYRYPRVTSALFANGVEPMYVPTYYYDRDVGRTGRPIKNSVDIHLCIDAMRTLYSQPNILKFVLVTGDRDFIPLVNAIRQHGKDVIVIGIGGAASAHLAQSADEFLFYEQIADLNAAQPVRAADEARKPEERRERGERPERSRGERAPKPETRPEPVTEAAAPLPPAPTAAPEERNPFDTLIDAVKLARQRGFVVNLGSLKVVMRELDSTFHESKAKDAAGKSFSKFKDFVKEAERQGKVQIFTNGTVTEIFLPEEDPYKLSQFAEDLASQRVERELETELEQEAQLAETASVTDVLPQAPEAAVGDVEVEAVQPAAEEIETAAPEAIGAPRPSFGDREWDVFRGSMSQFAEPVRFAEIFNALRGLRNQEVMELTNNELKELVKQAINRGLLQRTGRGARAYYRLSSQYRLPRTDVGDTAPIEPGEPVSTTSDGDGQAPAPEQAESPSPSTEARRRRARWYERIIAAPEVTAETVEPEPQLVAAGEAPSLGDATETDVAQAEPEASVEAEVTPPARRRRRKSPTSAANDQNGGAATNNERGEAPSQPEAAEGGSRRRRKQAPPAEAAPANDPPATEQRENGGKPRRRRKKAPAGDGGDAEQG